MEATLAFNPSGVFSRLYSWVTDRDNSIKINAPRMDAEMDGMADALNAIVGQTQPFIAPVKVPAGTAAAPSVTTTNDLDTGLYFPSAGQAAFAIDGVQRLLGTATYWQSSNPVYLPLGSAAAPSQAFTGDTNTGVYSTGADKWAVAVAGARFFELGGGDAYIGGRMTGYPVSQFPAFGSYGGTANAITVNTGGNSQDIGTTIAFKATAANTGATTINANGLGATACVTTTGAALPAGYIRTDVITIATLTGSGWMVRRLPEYGSDSNGEWWRYEDGFQRCVKKVNITQVASTNMSGTWTFPVPFKSGTIPTVKITPDATNWSSVAAGVARGDGSPLVGTTSNTQCVVSWWARTGAPSLVSGNNIDCYCEATGRWL